MTERGTSTGTGGVLISQCVARAWDADESRDALVKSVPMKLRGNPSTRLTSTARHAATAPTHQILDTRYQIHLPSSVQQAIIIHFAPLAA